MSWEECAAFAGIDWADQMHAVGLIDAQTKTLKLEQLAQQPEALHQWVAELQQRYPGKKIAVCLEQSRGALIYALMNFDCFLLVPINPMQLAAYRKALGPSGAKDDPTDARLLAEFLASHHGRLRVWQPEEAAIRKLRLLAEDRRTLVNQRTAQTNRLQDRLKQYFPLALEVSGSVIHGNLACQFLLRYPTLEKLQAASDEELAAFYREHRCRRPEVVEERLRLIREAIPLTTDQAIVASGELMVVMLVKQILALNEAIDQYDAQLAQIMHTHADAEIFTALPGSGRAMAPRLLAAMGSDRERLANAQEVQQLSGIAPVTRRSGKSHVVSQRWATNRFLRQTFHEFAAHSIKFSAWAKAYYRMMRARGKSCQAAIRALAFKWIRIIFRCWKDRTIYNEMAYCAVLIQKQSPLLKFMAETDKAKTKIPLKS